MKVQDLFRLIIPADVSWLGERENQLRNYLAVGSAIGLLPIFGLVLLQASLETDALFVLLVLLLLAVISNLLLLRSWRFTLWPARFSTLMVISLAGYSLFTQSYTHTLLWTVCVPPLLVFVFGRREGFFWSLLMLSTAILTLLGSGFEVEQAARVFVNLLLAFGLAVLFALAHQTLFRTTSISAVESGAKLDYEQQRFGEFASMGSDWLFEFDQDYQLTYVSDNLLSALPDASGAMQDRSVTSLAAFLKPSDQSKALQFAEAVQAREPIRKLRLDFIVDGRVFYVDITAQPQFVGDEYRGYRGVAEDVSAAVDYEQKIRQQDLVLHRAQKMEAIGQLTSGLAHDFNNLLTIMRGNLDLLTLDQPELSNDPQLRAIQHAGERAGELTSKLLAFARKQPLQPRDVDGLKLIHEMQDMLQSTIGEGIRLTINCQQDLWLCLVDAAQLESALLNLAINARDAMPNGGVLKIELRNETVVEDEQLSAGEYVCIDVCDNGVGIDESIREFVFDPFFSTKAQGQGSGLGLSMVFGFARQSGGDVRLVEGDSQGVCVHLWLPRGKAEGAIAEQIPEQSSGISRFKILAVEDDASVRILLNTMLLALGHEPIVLATAAGATEKYSGQNFDLLITDVVLADGENGLELAQNIRDLNPDTPVLFISGYAEPIADSGFQFDDKMHLLNKPFGLLDLRDALEELMK